jgi:hypothetical protein
MRSGLLALVALAISVFPASAQSVSSSRYDVAGGYAFMRDQDIADNNPDISANFPAGWMAAVGGTLPSGFGVVGEVSGSYKTVSIPGDQPKLRVYTFLGGPRFRKSLARIAPFGQVLFGVARATTSVLTVTETASDFAYQPGGGVDLDVSGRLGVRIEGDYRIIRSEGTNSKESRFTIAAVFGF